GAGVGAPATVHKPCTIPRKLENIPQRLSGLTPLPPLLFWALPTHFRCKSGKTHGQLVAAREPRRRASRRGPAYRGTAARASRSVPHIWLRVGGAAPGRTYRFVAVGHRQRPRPAHL